MLELLFWTGIFKILAKSLVIPGLFSIIRDLHNLYGQLVEQVSEESLI